MFGGSVQARLPSGQARRRPWEGPNRGAGSVQARLPSEQVRRRRRGEREIAVPLAAEDVSDRRGHKKARTDRARRAGGLLPGHGLMRSLIRYIAWKAIAAAKAS